jgi:hypothetical protein
MGNYVKNKKENATYLSVFHTGLLRQVDRPGHPIKSVWVGNSGRSNPWKIWCTVKSTRLPSRDIIPVRIEGPAMIKRNGIRSVIGEPDEWTIKYRYVF